MLETSHYSMEREVLLLLRRLHAEEGNVTRERLTVVGRGRGLEIARSLLQLKSLGLVEVVEKRPPFWRRLFGAKSREVLIPVPEETGAPLTPVAEAAAAPLAEAPFAPMVEDAAFEPAQAPLAEAPFAQPQYDQAVAPAAELLTPQEPPAAPYAPEPYSPAPFEALAPVAEPEQPFVQQPDTTEFAAPQPGPVEIPAEIPVAAPVAPQPIATAPSPRAPRPAPVPLGYTDELGGAPADFNLAPRLDPALVEGMRDFLAGMGLELTFAGEALAAQRLQGGASVGDVVGELVVFALAHAAHHESLSGFAGTAEDLHDYAQAILEELERLTEAGEIRPEEFETQKSLILQLSDRNADRSALVAALLSDPIGGAAPPAILPEELRGIEDGGDGFLQDH